MGTSAQASGAFKAAVSPLLDSAREVVLRRQRVDQLMEAAFQRAEEGKPILTRSLSLPLLDANGRVILDPTRRFPEKATGPVLTWRNWQKHPALLMLADELKAYGIDGAARTLARLMGQRYLSDDDERRALEECERFLNDLHRDLESRSFPAAAADTSIGPALQSTPVPPVVAQPTIKDSPWVVAQTLWPDRFKARKELNGFRSKHPEMFKNNPGGNKLYIHAAKWAEYWANRDKAGFESLDRELPSVADDPAVQAETLASVVRRMGKSREKKQTRKQ